MRLEIAAKKGARCLERGKCRNVREKANLQLTSDTTLVCPCKISSTGFFGLSKFQINAFWFDCKSPKPSNQSTKKKRKKKQKKFLTMVAMRFCALGCGFHWMSGTSHLLA